jgi:UDP-N-acetylglucosamine 2-epimerase (non-hydrolysing)
VTIESGTNVLLGLDPSRIAEIPALIAGRGDAASQPPPLWDGRAAERLAAEVAGYLGA